MKLSLKSALLVAAFVPVNAALADHGVVYAPRTEASAFSAGTQGLAFPTATSHFVNGNAFGGQNASPGGSTTGGGTTNFTFAQTQQTGFSGGLPSQHDSFASADLVNGLLKASTLASGRDVFGAPFGFASARIDETLFFTNLSDAAQLVTFSYLFDGQMTKPNDSNPGGSVSLGFACPSVNCYNDVGDRIVFGTGPLRTPNDNWNYYFDFNSPGYFGENIFGGQGAAPYFQYGLNQPGGGGIVDGFISAQLLIPTGLSSIGVRGTLNLDCRGVSSCDFGNTGRFGFGALPQGLSFSSASGVFLTGGIGAVPEPASWALMILGFGLVGSALRRRTTVRFNAKEMAR